MMISNVKGQFSAISGVISLDRKNFGLTWNAALETGGFLVGDEVAITLEVQVLKA
jgi:polyisoprenoid-binding protein YceI